MKKTLTLAGIVLSALMYSQSNSNQDYTQNTNDAGRNIPQISPTTPESFKFSQYGNIPIGMFTGAPNINIPLTAFELDGVSIPISLNYASNGINVDEMNGSVGLGWTFLSGGVITRTIRDKPDEKSNYNSGDAPLLENSASQMTEYLKFCEVDDFDSEPDLYSANFGGNNVKFLINKSGNIIMIDQKNYKIKKNDNGNLFSIILDNGVRYNFNAVENILNRTLNVGGHQPPLQYPQSWYLTSIVTTKGNTINFEYQNVNYSNTISQSQSLTYTTGVQQMYGGSGTGHNGGSYCPLVDYILPQNNIGLVADSEQVVSGKQISKISDSNNNSIIFSYSAQNGDYSKLTNVKKYHKNDIINDISLSYMTTNSSRLFLTEIKDNKSNSSHKFSYYNAEGLPARLSFSRDMWGYYNGRSNGNLIPQIFDQSSPSSPKYSGANQEIDAVAGYYGLLKNIIYPTGGNTQLNYENHKKKDFITIPATTAYMGLSVFNKTQPNMSTKEAVITPRKSGMVRITLSNYLYELDNCKNSPVLQTGKQKGSLEVKDKNGQYMTLYVKSVNAGYVPTGTSETSSLSTSKEVFISASKNEPITIVLTAMFGCCDAYARAYYYDKDDETVLADVLLGGYRISSTEDTPNNGAPIKRKYKYVRDNGDYSINVTREPLFKENRIVGSVCLGGSLTSTNTIILNYNSITSSNIGRLFSFNPNIFYDTVEEEIEGKGKIIHHFSSEKDYWGNPLRGDIISAPWTNSGWKNGKELLTVYKDNSNNTLKTIENNFVEDASRTFYLGAINRRKLFEPALNDGTWNGFENLDAVYYKNISRFTYLKSQKTTDYLNGTPVSSQTEYFYNNPSHYQLTKQSTSFPDGKLNEISFQYAHEKGNQLMIDKNMIGIPLETTTTQTIGSTTKTLSKAETIYPLNQSEANTKSSGLVLPLSVISYDNLNASPSTEVKYEKYDEKGNILQYTTKEGIPVAIVWGYNTTQPIAKIEGITYDQLLATTSVAAIISKSDEDAADPTKEGLLLDALNDFRKQSAFVGKQVSTFTYDPLIGVTSITPPSGIREVYVYDTANRLKEVKVREKDAAGNYVFKKVKEYNYNYKQ